MSSFKTAKGTDLPILSLRGKDYLEVKYRLVWFREEHADWPIETELLSVTDKSAYAKATIRDSAGKIIATSHKFENLAGFPDFIEKAETGAIGRALALIGYGTQFAPELEEGERIVDSPVEKKNPLKEHRKDQAMIAELPGEYICTFGKFKGQKVKDIDQFDLNNYVTYIYDSAKKQNKPITNGVLVFVETAEAYLKTLEFERG